jgi:hypothetical protein
MKVKYDYRLGLALILINRLARKKPGIVSSPFWTNCRLETLIQLISSPAPIRLVMGFPLVRRQSLGTILASRLSLDPKPPHQGAGFVPQYAGYCLHLPRYARYKSFSESVNILF